jgi:hypothetical protein
MPLSPPIFAAIDFLLHRLLEKCKQIRNFNQLSCRSLFLRRFDKNSYDFKVLTNTPAVVLLALGVVAISA